MVADAIKLVSNDGEDVTYVHPDHLGAPQKMTDKDRTVVWDASYLPFGEEDSIIGSAANDNRFPGQRLEAETGLHYNYFRDYDPTTGRYLQSDPIGLAGGINTYGYVSGNPVNYIDPKGEKALTLLWKLFEKSPVGKKVINFCTRKLGNLFTKAVPDHVLKTLGKIKSTGRSPSGYRGNQKFKNREKKLPIKDTDGNPIHYKEFDVKPHVKGVNRGQERIVMGSNGKSYYTKDHYKSFVEIK